MTILVHYLTIFTFIFCFEYAPFSHHHHYYLYYHHHHYYQAPMFQRQGLEPSPRALRTETRATPIASMNAPSVTRSFLNRRKW